MTSQALAVVERALLDAARSTAEHTLAQARAEAQRMVDAARADSEAALAKAREQGATDAAGAVRARRAAGRRAARAVVLSAKRRAYEDFAARAREVVRRQLDTPQTTEALIELARRALGPQTSIRLADGGAVVAMAPGRVVELDLDGLTDLAIAETGSDG
jgi:vacuolar-type H+-ATPase subunit E/Vma4